ncbi:MAG: AI-2E family transporter [Lautropia sp.]
MPISRRQRQTLLWSGVGLALASALLLLGPVLTPFVAAIVLAYVLLPGVDLLVRLKVPRVLAVVLAIVSGILLVVALVLVVIPVVQKEFLAARDRVPALVAAFTTTVVPRLEAVFGQNLPLDVASLKVWLTENLSSSLDQIAKATFTTLRSGGGVAIQVIGLVFLVPVVLFYLLLDWPTLTRRVLELVPHDWRGQFVDVVGEIDQLLGQYLRGQMRVMGTLALYYCAALLIARFDLWLPIGIVSGLLVFIPYVGFAAGLLFALLAGILQFGPLHGMVAVAIIYGLGQALESIWLTPRLVGERIGLHPLAVILALLAFGSIFGFVGVLLALPLAAALAVALRRTRDAYVKSDFYTGETRSRQA